MTISTTGLELKCFYTDAAMWSDRDGLPLYWVDGIGLAINGRDILDDADILALADSDRVHILSGFVYAYEHLGEVATLEQYFRLWRSGLNLLCTAPFAASRPTHRGVLGSLLGG